MIELWLFVIAKLVGVEVPMLLVGLGLEVARHIGINSIGTWS